MTSASAPLPRPHALRGYLLISGAALCWGFSAVLGKAAFNGRLVSGLSPIQPLILAQTRTTIAFLVLAPLLLLTRGRNALSLGRREAGYAMLLGVLGVAIANYAYYEAINLTTIATAIVLQYVAPIWVLLYMVARRLQKPTAPRIAAVGLAVGGIMLTLGVGSGGHFRLNPAGVFWAQMASFSFAYFNIVGEKLVAAHDRWKIMAWALLGAAVIWLPLNPPWKIVEAHYTGAQWGFLLMFSFTSMLIPFSLYFSGLRFLDPTRAIVTSCLEPVFAIILAAIFLGELLSPLQTFGVIVVLSATILIQRGIH